MTHEDRSERVSALEHQESRIRAQLELEESSLLRSGVAMIDYAVDQLRFFRTAWVELKEAGLSDVAALERVEFLSLPECLRQAQVPWKQELVLQYAFSQQWSGWQRTLAAHHANDHDRIGVVPRFPGIPGPMAQLSPYPSSVTLPPGPLVTLEANVGMDLGLVASPIHPMRPLLPGVTWSLSLSFFHTQHWQPLTCLIDPPWKFDPVTTQGALRDLAKRYEMLAELAPGATNAPPDNAVRQWRVTADNLRNAADQVVSVSASGRAAILQAFFSIPLTSYFTPVFFITEDMQADVMAMLIGFKLKEGGLLSAPEARIFDRFVEVRCLKDHPDVSAAGARRLGARMARFLRPLGSKSVTQYERLVLKGIQFHRPRKEGGVGKLLTSLANRHGLHLRKVYRDFRHFLAAKGLPRSREAFWQFARTVRRARGRTQRR